MTMLGLLKRREVAAWCLYDWADSAFATTVLACLLPVYYATVAGANLAGNTATVYWGYTTAAAMFLVALAAPWLGAFSDHFALKKRMLGICAAAGAVFTALLAGVERGEWLEASLIFIAANGAFAASEIFYNALLPAVARPGETDRVSSLGYALGYLGGGLLLAVNLAMIAKMADKAEAARWSFASVAVWWGIFTVPVLRGVTEPPRMGGPAASGPSAAFARVSETFRDIRKYKKLFLFLVAFWFYNDGIGTIIRMAVIYGAEAGIGQMDLIGALLMVQFIGLPATIAFGRLAGRIGARNGILLGLGVYILITIGGFFIRSPLHFWVLAGAVGLVQGGTQALSRSLFARLTPPDKTAEFFGFYGLSSKFAGIFGPAVFALIGQLTGSSRWSILAIVLFFVIGAALLARLDLRDA